VRICLAFDCLYPYTVGGGEHWYRALAEGVAARRHDVTYLTLQQWEKGSEPNLPGIQVVAVAGGLDLYAGGRRSIGTQLRYATGVLGHLIRHGGRYDVVQTPGLHLALLAVLAARSLRGYAVVVDWFEVWRRDYWLEYLGPVAGRLGWWGQQLTARSRHAALCFSRLHADRLRAMGHRGEITLVEGLRELPDPLTSPADAEPLVVFAGRHIPEKRVTAIAPAVAIARERLADLRAVIFGDGPDRDEVLGQIAELGLAGSVEAPGFAEADRVQDTIRHALCLVFPSAREGYGIVVVEASALGTPTVVVSGPDNAAAELVEDGVNGVVAVSGEPRDLADAILRVQATGRALRESTTGWFRANRERLSLTHSVDTITAVYASLRGVKGAGTR
jgi:glycosyltransferase involved in cell wall biosynthesis